MDRQELADFLRSRRARLRPPDVGLATGQRRRTPGLRREEVALLAAMSADYYTRLEQNRGPRPSRAVLSGLARALRLTDDERRRKTESSDPVPEADALEQTEEVRPEDDDDGVPSDRADVPEADALEQSRVVPLDDDEHR